MFGINISIKKKSTLVQESFESQLLQLEKYEEGVAYGNRRLRAQQEDFLEQLEEVREEATEIARRALLKEQLNHGVRVVHADRDSGASILLKVDPDNEQEISNALEEISRPF